MVAEIVEIRPQAGAQECFLSTPADIAIYGGAAGGGKSYGLLLEPLRYVTNNPDFYAVFFRRSTTQIRNPGGLWDESIKLYPYANGTPIQTILEWKWNGGGRVKLAHLEHEKTVLDWQGSQVTLLAFDELCHFSQSQFFYMLSRNRSVSGIKPYVRATCNPDADSWVAQFIEWWLDGNGFAIPERSGKLRWFVRVKGEIKWADTREECIALYGNDALPIDDPKQVQPKSVTFIAAKLEDNPALMEADPGYMSNLLALDIVSQARLLGGNWKIKWDTGLEVFREESLLVDGLPVIPQMHPNSIFAVVDTAVKAEVKHDGTAVTFFAEYKNFGHPLVILDWDITQIDCDLLENWIPAVYARCEELAVQLGARNGSLGAFIEDKQTGTVLINQAQRRGLPGRAIDSKLTSLGKDPRFIGASAYVHRGMVKISELAYNKTTAYKGTTKNHFLNQVCGVRIGAKDAADDLADTFAYGISLSLGNIDGF